MIFAPPPSPFASQFASLARHRVFQFSFPAEKVRASAEKERGFVEYHRRNTQRVG